MLVKGIAALCTLILLSPSAVEYNKAVYMYKCFWSTMSLLFSGSAC